MDKHLDMTFSEIALLVGFTPQNLRLQFKKLHGISLECRLN